MLSSEGRSRSYIAQVNSRVDELNTQPILLLCGTLCCKPSTLYAQYILLICVLCLF